MNLNSAAITIAAMNAFRFSFTLGFCSDQRRRDDPRPIRRIA
jgi:hypothetical protein